MKRLLVAAIGLILVGLLILVWPSAAPAGGGFRTTPPDFTRNQAPDKTCPNPYDPVTGRFVGFSQYFIDLGPGQSQFFAGGLEPGASGTDKFVGPDEIPVDLTIPPDGVPDAVFEPDLTVTGPAGMPVYRCLGTGGFDLGGVSGYGNPTGDNAG